MPKFDISITYSKTVDCTDRAEAERIIQSIADQSNLDAEYGPFSNDGYWTEVEEVKE